VAEHISITLVLLMYIYYLYTSILLSFDIDGIPNKTLIKMRSKKLDWKVA